MSNNGVLGDCSDVLHTELCVICFRNVCEVNLRWRQFVPDPELEHITPFQRYGHTVVAYGSKIYLWGGRNDEAVCKELFCFDTGFLL